ncbi:MAG TPA: DUF1697 domain-containing protein [Candidatus Thermoplasmatota archaeon]
MWRKSLDGNPSVAAKANRETGRRVAFVRGINVGGARSLRMDELRRLAAAAGFHNVTTLGASGNVLYSSNRPPTVDARKLTDLLVTQLQKATIVVRTASEMERIVRTAPFVKPDPSVPDKWRFVALLEKASEGLLPDLPAASPVKFAGRSEREVFYTMSEPTSHAIAMVARLERNLGTSLTVRNWNVVRTIAEKLNTP